MTKEKAQLYTTAVATISCAHFKAGECVSVRYRYTSSGTQWFDIDHTEKGKLPVTVAYPDHHLDQFCL